MKRLVVVVLISLLVTLTACSSNNNNSKNADQSASEPSPSAVVEAAPTSTPEAQVEDPAVDENTLTLENDGVDAAKFEETLAQFPSETAQRIVTTSVPLAEMLYLLGVEPVGVPTSTNPIPAAFDHVARIGSPMAPDLEVVTSLESDLLLGAESLRSTIEKNLESLDLTTSYMRTESFDDLKLSFKVLGTYLNKTEEMNKVLSGILEKENELNKRVVDKELPTVMLIIGTSDSFMVMSEASYLGSLVKRVGADNIATSALNLTATYSAINLEEIVAADPDIIMVLASGDHGANQEKFENEVANNDAWTKLSAYKNNKIHILDYSIFGVTSISNVDSALTTIADYFFE